MNSIRRDFLPADLESEMQASGVTGVISVQARQTLEETRWLLDFASQYEFIQAVVGWAPFIQQNISEIIGDFCRHPKLRGLRHILHDEVDPRYMLGETFNRGIASLRQFGLAYDILIFEHQLPQTIRFVDRHPDQIFIVDHCAKPRVERNEISPWRENIRELARRPNVYCKISGLVTEADYDTWTEDQLRPYFEIVLAAFTPQRLLFGSDWPVCLVASSYRNWITAVENAIGTLSPAEQGRIWWQTAAEAYRLRPGAESSSIS